MILKKAEGKDKEKVLQILAEGREAIAALGIDQWQNGYPQPEIIEEDILNGESYLLFDGFRPVGTCMITDRGEPTYDVIYGGKWRSENAYLTVHRIAVSDSVRGGGAASYIIECAVSMARERGLCSVRMDTHPGNVRMRRFLEKNGFLHCGTIMLDDREEPTPEHAAYERLVPPSLKHSSDK